jgi:hypothetical protein
MREWMAGSGVRAALLGLLAIMLAGAAPASADAISVFDVSGTFGDGSTLQGTLDIDVISGDATAINVLADGIHITNVIETTPNNPTPSLTTIFTSAEDVYAHLFLAFPVADLIGYAGGKLSTGSRIDEMPGGAYLVRGAVTLAPATAVPETSAWMMLLAGFAGLGVVGYRKAQRIDPQTGHVGA